MDLTKLLRDVKTLDDYISITQDLSRKYKTLNVQFNMSSVIALKKIRSLEIEFFNKCDDSGAAFLLFQRMQILPPSKTWNLLGKELVSLIQYWLDAVRKHLITHHFHWWSFLKHLLDFIKNIKLKDVALNNILVSETSESLLDIATRQRLTSDQRYEVLHTFNLVCAESSREIRLSLRPQFEHYFIKLSSIMSKCGHVPAQYVITETLLRWLQPRHDQAVRREAAAKWFPEDLFRRPTVQLFLERPWINFFQDARDFLNSLNEYDGQVISLVCKKLSIGKGVVISGTERRQTWLDVNLNDRCLTVLLEPRLMEALDGGRNHCSVLVVSCDNTIEARLDRESVEVTISVTMLGPPQWLPPEPGLLPDEDTTVKIVVSSRSDLMALDNALRGVFSDKYQVLLDFENVISSSPPLPDIFRRLINTEEDSRFSHPAKDLKRRKPSGYIVRPKNWRSPSSVSTSSLAQLHDKLEALPRYRFDKEPVSVCAQPELSSVTEVYETDDILSFKSTSTLKLRPVGVFNQAFKNKKSKSDDEIKASEELCDNTRKQTFDSKNSRSEGDKTNFIEDERTNSLLFAATVGSADESVIQSILERFPNGPENNLVDLLVQEALHAAKNERIDSGIVCDKGKKSQDFESSEAIENTPCVETVKTKPIIQRKNCTVVSKSTSDESNTEAINDTQISYVSVRKNNLLRKKTRQNSDRVIEKKDQSNNETLQAIEDLFAQNYAANQDREVIISPTLAKKINATSSDNSDDFDQFIVGNNFNMNEKELTDDVDIIDCLNSIVDQVCNDIDKCNKPLNRKTEKKKLKMTKGPLQEIRNTAKEADSEEVNKKTTLSTKPKPKSIKQTYKTGPKKQKAKPNNSKSKLILEPAKMTPIKEAINEVTDESVGKSTSPDTKPKQGNKEIRNKETPLARRKRKLYSPKDDQITANKALKQKTVIEQPLKPVETSSDEDDNVTLAEFKRRSESRSSSEVGKEVCQVTPKSTATCYKELEKERKKYKRTRIRKSKNRSETPLSPKTRKLNDVPLARRKRKLYSPKDDQITANKALKQETVIEQPLKPVETSSDEDDNVTLAEFKRRSESRSSSEVGKEVCQVTPKSTATCYKELEKERKKYKRTRIRKSKNRSETPLSPKTRKLNDVFDRLKVTIESKEKLTLADKQYKDKDFAIFNFTSDSEDEDFIKKKIEVRKRASTTTIDSGNSIMSLRRGRTLKKVFTDKDIEDKPSKRKKTVKRKNTKTKPKVDIPKDLIDERMRATAPEILNTSLIVEQPIDEGDNEPDPIINSPEIVRIDDIQIETFKVYTPHKKTNKEETVIRKEKAKTLEVPNDRDDATISPLPGLLVETVHAAPDKDETPTENMVQKFQKIYQAGPDYCINETNTTHNLVSDFERTNCSGQINNMEEFIEIQDYSVQEIGPDINREGKSDSGRSNKSSKNNTKYKLKLKNIDKGYQTDKTESVKQTKKKNSTKNCPVSAVEVIDRSIIPEDNGSKLDQKDNTYERKKLILKLNKDEATQIDKYDSKSPKTLSQKTSGSTSFKSKKSNTEKTLTEKLKSKKQNPLQINYLNLTEVRSERSIATDGITAHGVSTEAPPTPNNLNEQILIPRELEDLDQSILEYYLKLTNEINRTKKSSDKSSNSNKLPRVHLTRMSDEEISKYLSQQNSKASSTNVRENEIRRYLPSPKDSESEEHQSPKESSKEKRSPVFRRSSHDILRWLPSARTSNSDHDLDKSIATIKKVSSEIKSKNSSKKSTPEKHNKRRSIISPIKYISFDEILPSNRTRPRTSNEAKDQSNKSLTPKSKTVEKAIENKKHTLRKPIEQEFRKPLSTPESEISRSSQKDDSKITKSVKRKNEKEINVDGKRRKLGETDSEIIDLTESGPSMNSVDHWFRKNAALSSGAETIDIDMMQNMIERLDTTFSEIHHNTNKLFVHLFVDNQKQREELEEKRRELKRQACTYIVESICKLVNEQFIELDRSYQEMTDKIMGDLKRRATEFLHEDFKKKKAVVALLREDFQAVVEHLERIKNRR